MPAAQAAPKDAPLLHDEYMVYAPSMIEHIREGFHVPLSLKP